MEIQLTILGNSSATPTRDRNQSGQYLRMGTHYFLLDCGEGTQSRILKYDLSYQKIEAVFISHLHGDHFLGLPGLLNTMSLNGRKTPLRIIGPSGLAELLEHHFTLAESHMSFPLEFTELTEEVGLVYKTERIEVEAIAVQHRIPCFAYIFRESLTERTLNLDACKNASVPQAYYSELKKGADFELPNGEVIPNDLLTFPGEPPFSYGYITDTLYIEENVPRFAGLQVLYHEATFLNEMLDRAERTFHSTTSQAARFALKAQVHQLLIGHFSSRYQQLESHLEEARQIFPSTELALEGQTFTFK